MSFVLALHASAGFAAQPKASDIPDTFVGEDECKKALKLGNYGYYAPKNFQAHDRNPINGLDRVLLILEADTCINTEIAGPKGTYVVTKKDSRLRAYKKEDGSLEAYARDDCGNGVSGFSIPAPTAPAPPTLVERARELVAAATPEPVRQQDVALVSMTLVVPDKKGGFCSSKGCHWAAVIVGAVAIGYTAYYYWPCPPGQVRR